MFGSCHLSLSGSGHPPLPQHLVSKTQSGLEPFGLCWPPYFLLPLLLQGMVLPKGWAPTMTSSYCWDAKAVTLET